MREFELYGTVAAIVSVCDSLNYITEQEELTEVFRLVNNYLDPDGLFIFDVNMEVKFRKIADSTIAENREEGSFIWENTYYEEETHYERAYSLDEIKESLAQAGLVFVTAYDSFTHNPPTGESERICIIAREHGKKTV